MGRNGGQRKRVKGEVGIYRLPNGNYTLTVSVNNRGFESPQLPADATIHELRLQRVAFRQKKELELAGVVTAKIVADAAPTASDGTLRSDVPIFLNTLTGARKRDMAVFMNRWIAASDSPKLPPFGDRARDTISGVAIKTVLAQWERERVPHWTRHHLRQALSQFFTALNGKSGCNPVRDTSWQRPQRSVPRAIDYSVIQSIFDEIPDYVWTTKEGKTGPRCRSKIILMLEAATGWHPAMLNRIRPQDLNLKSGVATTWREKGGRRRVVTAQLVDDAIAPFKLFVAEKMFGRVRARAAARAWATAMKKAQAKWSAKRPGIPFPVPENCRPYDLRHSFGTEMYKRCGDERAVGEMVGHAPGSSMTPQYTIGAVSTRVAVAARKARKLFTGGKRRAATRAA